jgi:hypothetical protein
VAALSDSAILDHPGQTTSTVRLRITSSLSGRREAAEGLSSRCQGESVHVDEKFQRCVATKCMKEIQCVADAKSRSAIIETRCTAVNDRFESLEDPWSVVFLGCSDPQSVWQRQPIDPAFETCSTLAIPAIWLSVSGSLLIFTVKPLPTTMNSSGRDSSKSMAPSSASNVPVFHARDNDASKRYPPSETDCVARGLLAWRTTPRVSPSALGGCEHVLQAGERCVCLHDCRLGIS